MEGEDPRGRREGRREGRAAEGRKISPHGHFYS